MAKDRSPREVFLALVHGIAEGRWDDLPDLYAEQTHIVHPLLPTDTTPMRTRDELREHFRPKEPTGHRLQRRPVDITIHETTDPEVIIAEFAYRGTVVETGEAFSVPCVFVMRVRDGEIVSSRDYLDHISSARARGELDELIEAIRAQAPASHE